MDTENSAGVPTPTVLPEPLVPSHGRFLLCHGHGLFFHGLMRTLYFCMESRVLYAAQLIFLISYS
jgi:hypothetical protein